MHKQLLEQRCRAGGLIDVFAEVPLAASRLALVAHRPITALGFWHVLPADGAPIAASEASLVAAKGELFLGVGICF